MEAVVTIGAINRAKLQSNHHHQQTNTQFLLAGCPSCRPTISSWLKFGHPVPPGRGSEAGRKLLALPHDSQRAVFASPLSAFFIIIVSMLFPSVRWHCLQWRLSPLGAVAQIPLSEFPMSSSPSFRHAFYLFLSLSSPLLLSTPALSPILAPSPVESWHVGATTGIFF